MRQVKGDGGLTGATGFEMMQHNTYLYSRPVCAEISSAIEDITEVNHRNSEQHQKLRPSRVERDLRDCQLLTRFLLTTTLLLKLLGICLTYLRELLHIQLSTLTVCGWLADQLLKTWKCARLPLTNTKNLFTS